MSSITRLLVANRGEIACRIIRTAKQMGIHTVSIYSDIDAQAQHVIQADEAHCVGLAPASQSYLEQDKILDIARKAKVDAIHPGYGFLSENAEFAQKCAKHGIIFVGPPSTAIIAMGSKSQAKRIMEQAGVPLTKGYHGDVQDENFLAQRAAEIGYPVILKASAGGGGKGMRIVRGANEFTEQLAAAKREARKSFSNEHMLIETYVSEPRHIEVQVFCDSHGNGVYLFDRDCSIQRRYQKIIEEAPAPGLSDATRQAMGEAAVQAAQAIDYVGAGTVEFLLDSQHQFYFMEMNTRLQVEHPVTEMITDQDLVQWQLHIACGGTLPLLQEQLCCSGHAVEARIYAEDPSHDFLPQTGILHRYKEPQDSHIRIDSGVTQGDEISIYYDPMISKVISHAPTRQQAIHRLYKAVEGYVILGCRTNIDYIQSILKHRAFNDAHLTTHFVEDYASDLKPNIGEMTHIMECLLAMCLFAVNSKSYHSNADLSTHFDTIGVRSQFRVNHTGTSPIVLANHSTAYISLHDESALITLNGTTIPISQWHMQGDSFRAVINGLNYNGCFYQSASHRYIFCNGLTMNVSIPQTEYINSDSDNDYTAPMNGTVVKVNVSPGQPVSKDETLVILEAMKMEHTIKAKSNGTVTQVVCTEGQMVTGGQNLLDIEALPLDEAKP